ncbi:hypothetical protein OGAPHI_004501 [Ogataea philodendri]|uniref:Secreted protein n=1 Tax=Ogataea philodendri TaxID=1378263 RepID=A0A9P8P7M0_9ASCO|nr:uncharacterized protein OGAPHI_004501 [Ogataea philodendri]KAH3666312.1 hypothetical protein OGAPHI_004501 [Ogataea philodendri]
MVKAKNLIIPVLMLMNSLIFIKLCEASLSAVAIFCFSSDWAPDSFTQKYESKFHSVTLIAFAQWEFSWLVWTPMKKPHIPVTNTITGIVASTRSVMRQE